MIGEADAACKQLERLKEEEAGLVFDEAEINGWNKIVLNWYDKMQEFHNFFINNPMAGNLRKRYTDLIKSSRAVSHDEAVSTVRLTATVTPLSHQEAIEKYLKLRGMEEPKL